MKVIVYCIRNILAIYKYWVNRNFFLGGRTKYDIAAAELLRNIHSIEKGLSIENPRKGFGHKKQEQMMQQVLLLIKSDSLVHQDICKMALDALNEYIIFHKKQGYSDNVIEKISRFLTERNYTEMTEKWGGTQVFNKSELKFNIDEIERFFITRHSIRDFSKEPVDEKLLKKALQLAQQAPSACNRQAVRVYVLGDVQRKVLTGQLSGIGGFADAVSKFVLITAKTTAYRLDEVNQYIVSASMYAAYCTLTLHLYGMGACVVQRQVIWSRQWEKWKKDWNIAKDEQIICLLAVGNLKERCKVPVSHRIKNEEMVRFM